MNNIIKVGDTFTEKMLSDKSLYIITDVISQNHFKAKSVQTSIKNFFDGIEYPEIDLDGNWLTFDNEVNFIKKKNVWYKGCYLTQLCWGAKTGFKDPSF